jgi:hypothetical protein
LASTGPGAATEYSLGRLVEDIDIWRAAQQLIKRYGQGAFIAACQRGDAALEKDDREAFRVWQRVSTAILELERTTLSVGDERH